MKVVENGEYARVYKDASELDQGVLLAALEEAKNAKTLTAAAQKLEKLLEEVESIDKSTQQYTRATEAFPGIEKQYESIVSIDTDDLAEESNAQALAGIKKRLQQEWEWLQKFQEADQRENFSSSVLTGVFPELLQKAMELVAQDGDTAQKLLEAKEEAARLQREAEEAARLRAEQRAERLRLERERDKKLGIEEGEKRFGRHSNGIIQAVWRKTKQYAPLAQNESIRGEYSYTDIMNAIGEWGAGIGVGLLTRTFVPGGGSIQDKRTKNSKRNEIQANFISDWDGNSINIHVNLKQSDWPTYFPDRDK